MRQITGSLEEERSWAQELENERDQFRERLEVEIRLREKQDRDRVQSIEELRDEGRELREEVKELKEQLFRRETIVEQYKNDLVEQDRLLKQKSALLEEKCRAYEELSQVSEKRKKQIIQLRASVKTRDDALTEINNKHRALLSQVNYVGNNHPFFFVLFLVIKTIITFRVRSAKTVMALSVPRPVVPRLYFL